jgi:valyl-tRNA synthetase
VATFSMPKTYDFRAVEEKLYAMWNESGYFRPRQVGEGRPFVISMPPPNVTGELHLGHAMFVAMEDLLIRYHRMRGEPTLWVPGSDHAGIATQLQVEKDLRSEGRSREEIGRQAFEERAWAWKRKYGGVITRQLRRLGASCDWERERFTLDEGLSQAVREAFVRLYEKGLIFRGTYLINWSPGLRTAVSDLEVEYSEEQGQLYYFNYPVAGSEEVIPVATTRPETILGDTAVAVHPDDERFRHLIGKTCLVPILKRPIPVIHDTYVDREFGTGALKITPGHDPADYEIGQRHGLEIVNVLNPDASMNDAAGPYAGLDRFECRRRLWEDMQAAGLTIKTEPYTMQVPRSQRGGEIVEPIVSTQWFVRMAPLAEAGLQAVRSGDIEIVPERFTKVYFNWLENIRDWCISRQLWWGHRIPAWYCDACGEMTVSRTDPTVCSACGGAGLTQDPDVLDTWFSSGLWPFSTLGWPQDTQDLRTFYPTSVMETGYDILFFWVARMIMLGLEFTGEAPFRTVYLHGMIRDGQGRKMSKTLGNVIDPLHVMDEFGADALRLALLTGSTPGNDVNLSLQRVEANRNFANKLWNATRLVTASVGRATGSAPDTLAAHASTADRWILGRLDQVVTDVGRLFDAYQFGEGGRQIYEFFWGEFADWYLESAKLQLDRSRDECWSTVRTMVGVLDACLRLLHPFTPFVTEEAWQHLKRACQAQSDDLAPEEGWAEALIVALWPEPSGRPAQALDAIAEFKILQTVVTGIRNARAEKGLDARQRLAAQVGAGEHTATLLAQRDLLVHLARLDADRVVIEPRVEAPPGAVPLVVANIEVYLLFEQDVDLAQERQRLERALAAAEGQIERLENLLSSAFAQRAPGAVVNKERDNLAVHKMEAEKLRQQLGSLGD